MGMTIDEAIHDTEVMKEYLECRGEIRSEGLGVAIDTMRKYQKIEQAYSDYLETMDSDKLADLISTII